MKLHIQQHQKLAMGISDKKKSERASNMECVNRESINKFDNKNQSASVNFQGGFFKLKDPKTFYTSKGMQKFAKLTTNPVLLESVAAIGFASVLRPATIMAMPGDKRDKQYAAAHGVATGIWGYATASLVYGPLEKAAGNVAKNAKLAAKNGKSYLSKNKKIDEGAMRVYETLGKYGPKFALRPLEAAMTIAFIPFVMKNVFPKQHAAKQQAKLDKKLADQPQTQSQTQSAEVKKEQTDTAFKRNFKIKNADKVNETFKNFTGNKNVAFSGSTESLRAIAKKAAEGEKTWIKKYQAYLGALIEPTAKKIMENKTVQKVLNYFAKEPKLPENPKLDKHGNPKKTKSRHEHLKTALISGTALLGTFAYMNRTMKSTEIEPERKKTLAANQAITWALSTVGGFVLDDLVFDKFKAMGGKYKEHNINLINEQEKNGTIKDRADFKEFVQKKANAAKKTLSEQVQDFKKAEIGKIEYRAKDGFGGWAPKLIAFTLMYRYLTPIVATPIADYWKNHIAKNPDKVKAKHDNYSGTYKGQMQLNQTQKTNAA